MKNLIDAYRDIIREDQEVIAQLSKIFEEDEVTLYGKDGKFWVSVKGKPDRKISMSWQSVRFLKEIINAARK